MSSQSFSSSPSPDPLSGGGPFDGVTLPKTRVQEFEALGFKRLGGSGVLLHDQSGGVSVGRSGVAILSDMVQKQAVAAGLVTGIERLSGEDAAQDTCFAYALNLAAAHNSDGAAEGDRKLSFVRIRMRVPAASSTFYDERTVSMVLGADLGAGVVFSDSLSFSAVEKTGPVIDQLKSAGAAPDPKEPRLWRMPFFEGTPGPEILFVLSGSGSIERILTPVPVREAGEMRPLQQLVSDDAVTVRGWPKPPSVHHPGVALSFWRHDAFQQMVVGEEHKAALACRSQFDLFDLSVSNGQLLPLRTNLSALFSVMTNEWMLDVLGVPDRRRFKTLIDESRSFGESLNQELRIRTPKMISGATITRWLVQNSEGLFNLSLSLVNDSRHFLIKHLSDAKRITTGDLAALMAGHPDAERDFPRTHAHILRFNLARSLLSSWILWGDVSTEFDRSGAFGNVLPSSALVKRVMDGFDTVTPETARLLKGYEAACPHGNRWPSDQIRTLIRETSDWEPDWTSVCEILEMSAEGRSPRQLWDTASLQANWCMSRLIIDCKRESDRFFDLLGEAQVLQLLMDNFGGYGGHPEIDASFRRLRGLGGALRVAGSGIPPGLER